ncbi:MAG: sulfatase [Henriciella sp.]
MWKSILVSVPVLLLIMGGAAYLNRTSILLYLASQTNKQDVAQPQSIDWQTGPEQLVENRSDGLPNIVFILADDLGINDISTFGGGVAGGLVKTPNIDRLAAEGAVFTNAYSGTATCAPSRAMLMTGRYASRTGFEFTPAPNNMGRIVSMLASGDQEEIGLPPVKQNPEHRKAAIDYADQGLPAEEVTIAEVLKPAGYHNVHIGKWHLGRAAPFRAVSQGFDESLIMASGLYLPEDHSDAVNAKLDFDPLDKFLWAQMQFASDYDRAGEPALEEWFEPDGYITDYYTDEAIKVIEANKNRPFFLYLAHWGTHTPLQATKADFDAVGDITPHRLRVYAAMVRAIDRSVGRIMDKLEAEGLSENTIVIFSSDNGAAGYVGLSDLNDPYRGWKTTLFEGGIRVPFFMKWPDRIKPGTQIDEPISHIDLLPTLASATSARLPDSVLIDGHNFLPLASGEASSIQRRDNALFWSSGFYKAVRAGDWKLQVNAEQGKLWLYNLADDPTEQVDVSERYPEKLQELQSLIDAHWENARAPLYPHAMEWPVRIDKTTADPMEHGDEYTIWAN